ncbi:MAG TPA: M56 family metallopeptidase [Bryobacteraceae bacterium]|nr:M56 family metallopeptidase [Bryobacteraceae bacterium]
MELALAWNNLLMYSLQIGLVIGLAAFLPALLRLRAPGARLVYWHLLLAACLLLPVVRPWQPQLIEGDVEISTIVTQAVPAAPGPHGIPWNGLLLALVAAGAAGRMVWLGIGIFRLRKYRRHAVRLEGIALLSRDVQSPVTFGWRRPVILLPVRFPHLPASLQRAILCHETLHVERHDWLFTLAEELVRAVFWFHPAIWWLLGEIQLAREEAVDRRVVELTGERDPYVDALLAVAGADAYPDLAPAPLFLRRRHLKQRVIGILKEKHMSQKILVPALAASLALMAAACWFVTGAVPLVAAPQADAGGVTVNLNGAPLMHRTPVTYPPGAIEKGIQGTVAVQVKLDSTGEVSDAAVVSGPDELRKAVVQSVLGWHFSKDVGGSTRTITVDFVVPQGSQQPAAALQSVVTVAPGLKDGQTLTVKDIEVQGLSDEARTGLLAKLPVHAGDTLDHDAAVRAMTAIKGFDSHLSMSVSTGSDGAATLRIIPMTAPPAVPSRIRVGGNVQAAMLISQVKPVYPPDAKAAKIQGTVRMQAVIGPDGHVQDLTVTEGDPSLATAAMQAVWQWVYKPTLLNGQPVSVATNIDVNFTLAN